MNFFNWKRKGNFKHYQSVWYTLPLSTSGST